MFPFIRLIVEVVIAVSVIRSVLRFFQGLGGRIGTQPRPRMNYPASAPGATMLQQDPVCGTYVAVDASLKTIVNGKVLHFCSAGCRDKYRG